MIRSGLIHWFLAVILIGVLLAETLLQGKSQTGTRALTTTEVRQLQIEYLHEQKVKSQITALEKQVQELRMMCAQIKRAAK